MKRILSDEIIGFSLGVLFVGIVGWLVLEETTVMGVMGILLRIYWVDLLVVGIVGE